MNINNKTQDSVRLDKNAKNRLQAGFSVCICRREFSSRFFHENGQTDKQFPENLCLNGGFLFPREVSSTAKFAVNPKEQDNTNRSQLTIGIRILIACQERQK